MKHNKKVKTFQVSEAVHAEILQYCNTNSLKINQFVEKLLIHTMRNLNDRKETQLFLQDHEQD